MSSENSIRAVTLDFRARSGYEGAMNGPTPRRDPRVLRYCLLSFALDFKLYVVWTVLPFKALTLHGDAFFLGLMPAVSAVAYIITCALTGGVTDVARRFRIGAAGCVLMAGGCLMERSADSLAAMAIATIPLGVGSGFFWPAVQSGIGRLSAGEGLGRSIGLFNILWSSGKGLGFLVGGFLLDTLGGDIALAFGAAISVAAGLWLPADTGRDARPDAAATAPPRADMGRFMKAAWLANFAAWGIGAVLNSQYPKLVEGCADRELHFGILLGLIYLSQTLVFARLGRWSGWIGDARLLYVCEGAGALAIAALPWCACRWTAYLLAPVFGASLGLCYVSSIYYSLRAGERNEGKWVGFHEAVLGSGNILVPILGGAVAAQSGFSPAPFLLAALVMAVMMVVQRTRIRI